MDTMYPPDAADIIAQITGNVFVQIFLAVGILACVQILLHGFITTLVRQAVKGGKHVTKREEKQREDTLIAVFRTATAIIIWGTGVFIILGILHINVAAILTGAGLIGILIGFGAQSTVKDIVAGIFVILENQYRVGDTIKANVLGTGGLSGTVESITIRITRLRDLDGVVHIIPNGQIIAVSNMTLGYANVNLDFTVPYDTDVKKIEKLINQVGTELAKEAAWQEKFIEPIKFLRVDTFSDGTLTVKALGKVQPAEQWSVAGEYRRRLKEVLDKHKITQVEESED